eukprot:157929_1
MLHPKTQQLSLHINQVPSYNPIATVPPTYSTFHPCIAPIYLPSFNTSYPTYQTYLPTQISSGKPMYNITPSHIDMMETGTSWNDASTNEVALDSNIAAIMFRLSGCDDTRLYQETQYIKCAPRSRQR